MKKKVVMNIGDQVSDYIIDCVLGEGGMGAVYLARHTILDQQIAIKVLDPEVARKPGIKERFIQEANIQARLKHPHIVQVLTATKTDGGTPALIMEYVEGKSLSEVLQLRGALPVDDALKIMDQVFAAVGYAHRQGVIHRDLKPSNVMVMASGEVKVTDFGIAKVLGSSKLTRTGTAMGSAHYMSPEQIRRPEAVDARSDIYSLGCVFYEVLTGRPPFGEKDASGTESDYEVKTAHVTEAAPALETVKSGIPAWLAKLVMNMLAKEPDQRPPSCEVIAATLVVGNVEKIEIIQDNEKPNWGYKDGDKGEIQKKSLKIAEVSLTEKNADASLNVVVAIIVVLVAIVSGMILTVGRVAPSDKHDAVASKESTEPLREEIPEIVTYEPDPDASDCSNDCFLTAGTHKIEVFYIGSKYLGSLKADQLGDGGWHVISEPSDNQSKNEIRFQGTMLQLSQNHFMISGGVSLMGENHLPVYMTIGVHNNCDLIKVMGKNFFQSKKNDGCLGDGSYIRFYP